ncbi:hypothetical protein Gotri_015142 [Gossypium trilobum]|uniref:C3H1-type domain-containing protein n=1 Tax=Gossypium trilobum TaxID=34281 RepID=A0A7J9DZF5_9ROSI|nr:hypothetical protein [Gossypium trilobum]
MQNDNVSTAYGDLAAGKLNHHQNGGVYSSSTANSSASLLALHHPRLLMQQHQDMINRHSLCLSRFREAAKEAESLRQENTSLRSVNSDLNKQLNALFQASVQDHFASSDYNTTPFDLVNASNGYQKMMSKAGAASHRGKTRGLARTSNASQQISRATNVKQKVYVQGGKEEEELLELEVYNQGMLKTELCNKWQETGACPYGDHCQFAHSVEELRPVIRHPRYKTEVCRMVLTGDVCSYGHRCHFRHALTEQEKSIGHLKPQTR